MADPVLKFPPEQKGNPLATPKNNIAAEPRRRLMARMRHHRRVLLLVVLPLVLAVVQPRTLARDSAWLLALPLVSSVVFVDVTTIVANWPTFARYLYGAGPAWLLFVFVAVRNVLPYRAAPLTVLRLDKPASWRTE